MGAQFLVAVRNWYDGIRDSRLYPLTTQGVFRVLGAVIFPGIVIFAYLTARYSFDPFRHNDYDLLPYARQYVNPDWLPADWYLNLKIGYRYAFNLIAGYLCDDLSFPLARLIGRTLVAGLFAVCLTAFQRSLRMYALLILPVLAYFIQEQSFFSDESFLLRFEAKCFAYGFAILSMASLFKSRYRLMLASLGLALSFHVLVGFYAGFCTVCVLAIEGEHRRNWKVLLKNSYLLVLTGILGVYAVVVQLFSTTSLPADEVIRAANIYTTIRVPHHVFPPAFGPIDVWGVTLVKRCLPLLIPLFLGKSPLRQFSIYILCSLVLVGVGLGFSSLCWTHLLKYYWFRYPATMIPFSYPVVIATLASMAWRRALDYAWISGEIVKWGTVLVSVALTISLLQLNGRELYRPQMVTIPKVVLGPSILEIASAPLEKEVRHPLRNWILQNTSGNDVFLVDPQMDSFYVVAERPRVVSFKHSPQSEKDILEWYQRLLSISGLRAIDKRGFANGPILRRGFCGLSEDQIGQLAQKYQVKYVLHRGCRRNLSFPVAFRNRRYTIYRIP